VASTSRLFQPTPFTILPFKPSIMYLNLLDYPRGFVSFFSFQNFRFHCLTVSSFVSSFPFIFFSQISVVVSTYLTSQILSRRPPPILLRTKESKASSTNEDEEMVTREG
jgi:hypothetical protein